VVSISHLQSIEHYNKTFLKDAELHSDNVMVLRENVDKITGMKTGGGHTDIRTGKNILGKCRL